MVITKSILDEIFAYTQKNLIEKKQRVPLKFLESKLTTRNVRNFKKALTGNSIKIIAEIKRKSPSQGIIQKEFDHKKTAMIYEKAHVDAISVLTEPYYFGGEMRFLSEVKMLTSIPIFRKDFIFDPYQIYESRYLGADAFLLIAGMIEKQALQSLIKIGTSLHMDALVEVHTEEELNIALEANAQIIGINNRNLHSFSEDLSVFEELAPKVPHDKLIVAESGIKTGEDIRRMRKAGAHAVLIGTALMKSSNAYGLLQQLRGDYEE